MENHPIPEDVTGFKFKLIGSMTVKQFLYLFAAGILCFAFIIGQVPIYIKIPFIFFFSTIGISLAFIPIDGRPMDKMILNFIKTIPSENQYIYKKQGIDLFVEPKRVKINKKMQLQQKAAGQEESDKKAYLLNQLRNSYFGADPDESAFLNRLKPLFDSATTTMQQTAPAVTQQPTAVFNQQPVQMTNLSSPVIIKNFVEEKKEEKEEELMEEKKQEEENIQIEQALKKLQDQTPPTPQPQTTTAPPLKPVEDTTSPLNAKDLNAYRQNAVKGTSASVASQIKPGQNILSGFPSLPEIPNIVLGIVKDPRGKVLPGVIVEVIDENGNPVRAFKTNQLGQFASATSLPNGKYKVFLEDSQKQQEFQPVEISLDGTIFQPLEVISTDAREKLRKELFGG